jgi:mRNA-degrading endonuclease RelE of RelBE toxin-antitoxin system
MQWDKIMEAAEHLSSKIREMTKEYKDEKQIKSFLGEAEKSLQYYVFKKYDDTAMERYLKEMAENPPPRSKQTRNHYQKIYRIWQEWSRHCKSEGLEGVDMARAWGWGVRIAKS